MTGDKIPAVGSRAQVWHGNAKHTSGGLTKGDLMMRKGHIISKKKHSQGKKAYKAMDAETKKLWSANKIAKKSKSKSRSK